MGLETKYKTLLETESAALTKRRQEAEGLAAVKAGILGAAGSVSSLISGVTQGEQAEETAKEIADHMEGYFNFNMVGTVAFKSATWPCYICGYGLKCQYGGPALFYGEKWSETKEITPDMTKDFKDDVSTVERCEKVSSALKAAVLK